MKLKRKSGGHVTQTGYYTIAKTLRKPSERFDPLGPFKIDGKDFVAIAFFNRQSYHKWMIQSGLNVLVSFFYAPYYIKATSLAPKTKGMLILDDKVHFVSDSKQSLKIARTALVWIDVYLRPAFPPGLFRLVDKSMKVERKIFEQCRDRKIPKSEKPAEKLYLDELKKADKQVVDFHPIFVRYHKLLKTATNLFSGISDNPSEARVMSLKPVMKNLAATFEELAKWCEERAKSWTDFVDNAEIYRKSQEKKKNLFERYGKKAIGTALMGVFAHIASGGNFAFSTVLSVVSMFGREGFKMILSFRWQAKTLKKSALMYRRFSSRVEDFLKLYDMPLKKGFIR